MPPRTLPTLKSMSLKKVKQLMKTLPSYETDVKKDPVYSAVVQDTTKQVQRKIEQTITANNKSVPFKLKRLFHLQLIHAIIKVLTSEPDNVVIDIKFSRRHVVMTLTSDIAEDGEVIYHASLQKNQHPWKDMTFWARRDMTAFLVDTFQEEKPSTIEVSRSQFALPESSPKEFVRNVNDILGVENIPRSMINLFNKRSVRIPELGIISPTPVLRSV